ncbi:anthranilate phosphoribosyltransferase [Candidatus Nitrosotalea bavarica]|uniref:anthranilate phosphoribosyltransferase n=1 Tax=Candidatus Nitrosotalea bavarica TaxID=1903277 RepID=UPI000C703669|nr:anthranilate phosphoribosyltransferase [Candidatus Nitrosotalea bavarica]
MISEYITKISSNKNLSYDEMSQIMKEILSGKISVDETTNFLRTLTEKGETDQELLAMLDEMQENAIHIRPKIDQNIIDVCGTGGDRLSTFNISTSASFVIAASGVVVAKHGNKSSSGISGSADIFEYFGYDLNMEPNKVQEIIEKFGIGFMFAPKFHPAMKNVVEARKIIGKRTAFNLLGPLTNPASVKHQLVGVYSKEYLSRVISLLESRGSESVMTVISEDGLDELSTTSKNYIYQLNKGEVTSSVLDPAELGLSKAKLQDLQVSTSDEAINAFVSVLNGTAKKSMLEITALNAAAGLIVGGFSEKFDEALSISLQTIKKGKAYDLFRDFIKYCGDVTKLEAFEKK